jgi:Asp-tRNA(Asn)/Glu-tRNA(Gln) amidotransferase A subunit family amidase
MAGLRKLTATAAAQRLRGGRITASALMTACLDRIAEREATVHAFAYINPTAAMRVAEKADQDGPRGLLHGLPLGVKDVLDTAAMPTTYGSPIWAGHRPRSSVADCGFLVGAVAGFDLGNPELKPGRTPRLALCQGPLAERAAPETLALLERAGAAAARAGAQVEPLELSSEVTAAATAHAMVMHAETAQALAWELTEMPSLVSPALRDKAAWVHLQPPEALGIARCTLAAARCAFLRDTQGFDAILTPSAPGEAPEGLASTGDPAFNHLWSALHAPCVTIPAGSGPRGLPLGLQIVSRPREDHQALTWAEWVRNAIT